LFCHVEIDDLGHFGRVAWRYLALGYSPVERCLHCGRVGGRRVGRVSILCAGHTAHENRRHRNRSQNRFHDNHFGFWVFVLWMTMAIWLVFASPKRDAALWWDWRSRIGGWRQEVGAMTASPQ
jgi:hypothetical protein